MMTVLFVDSHIGMLVTTIDAGQNMSACDVHLGIATYLTCRTVPQTWSIRNNTATATIYVAIVGVTVGSRRLTAF